MNSRIETLVIMGYGAPRHPGQDTVLGSYLAAALKAAEASPGATILLCGGATNNPSCTEARAMHEWITYHRHELVNRCVQLGSEVSTKEVLLGLAGTMSGRGMAVACYDTHAWVVQLYLDEYFPKSGAQVIAIATPDGDRLRVRAKRAVAEILEFVALYLITAERARKALRWREIERARARFAAE